MKFNWKRSVAVSLVLAGVFAFGMSSFAEENSKTESSAQTQTVDEVYVNPIYDEFITEEDLAVASYSAATLYSASEIAEETEYLSSVYEAGEVIKESMKLREETVVLYYQAEEYSKDLLIEIAYQALEHTGDSTEGDYLKWQYGGWSSSTSYYIQNDVYYMTITYTYVYYTTYEQELELDQAVSELLDELDVYDSKDYEKICAIYDYICANVEYDYDNLSNDAYTLKYSAYAALMDESAVCQGYAVLFYRLALELDVDSRVISGVSSSEAHGWNIVELYDLYYNVDSTWDAGSTTYSYFLTSDENFKGHTRDDEYLTDEFYSEYPMDTENYVDVLRVDTPEIISVYSQVQTTAKTTWYAMDDVTGYILMRATSIDAPEDEWSITKTIKGDDIAKYTRDDTIQYTNVDLELGVTYYYKVCAYQEVDGEIVYSNYSNIGYMPATVQFDWVYSNSSEKVRILWNEIDGADGYQIWRMDAEGNSSIVKTIGDQGNILTDDQGDTVEYINTGLEAGEIYTYYMRAFSISDSGKVFGVFSDLYEVAVRPEAPVLEVEQYKTDRVTLSWNEVNGASGYQIWRADSETGEYSIVKSITDGEITSYVNQDLVEGQEYFYKIRAYVELDGEKTFGEFSEIQNNSDLY